MSRHLLAITQHWVTRIEIRPDIEFSFIKQAIKILLTFDQLRSHSPKYQ